MKTFLTCSFLILLLGGTTHAQWTQTNGPEGGAVFELFADGANLYAGTFAAGVFRSTNGGSTWQQKINGMGYQSTTAIMKIGPYLLASGTVGLYRSSDDGETWTPATGLPGGNGVNGLAVIGPHAFASTMGKGVYASEDSGATWSAANSGLPGAGANTYVGSIAAIGTTLLASASNSSNLGPMYRSTDFGASWSVANTGLPSEFISYDAMYSDGSTVYAGGYNLYKTTNSGDSWIAAESGIPTGSGISEIMSSGSSVFAAAWNYMYRSTDGGASWAALGGGLPFMTMVAVEIVGSATYAGTIADGVYKSIDNGTTWSPQNTGLKARDMNDFLVDGTALYGNGDSVFATTNNGDTWTSVRVNLRDSASMPTLLYVNGPTMFVREGTNPDRISRSTDGGATWNYADNGLSGFYSVGPFLSSGGALLAPAGRIYRSTDNGGTWLQVDSALGSLVGFAGLYKAGTTIYAYGLGVAISTDDGATWVKSDSGFASFFGIGGFAAVGSTLFAGGGFPNAIYKSTDGGSYWRTVTNLPSGGGTSQLLGFGGGLFACSPNNGIFVSTNLGSTWARISTGLPNPNYQYSLAIRNGMMFAGTSGNSVWKRPLTDVLAVREITTALPSRFALGQNYPNPFNPATTIEFRIAESGQASLKVYDILGREIATLVNEPLHAGTYETVWDASAFPSGVYYCRLTTSGSSEVRKMSIIK